MTAEEYLNQARLLSVKIRQRQRMIDNIRETLLAGGIDYSIDRVCHSSNGDTMKAVDQIVDLTHGITQEKMVLVYKRKEIIDRIERIESPKYVELLELRYIEEMKFEQIAKKMNYAPVYVRRLHAEALEAFRKANSDIIDTQCYIDIC